MPEDSSERGPIGKATTLLNREPVVARLYRDEIESTARQLESPGALSLDPEDHLVDILGNRSQLITGELAQELVGKGYSFLFSLKELSRGRVSRCRDAGEVVLKEGVYSDRNRERYRLVVAFRHVAQQQDASFFGERLGPRHIPPTEVLVVPGDQGPTNLIAQQKVTGRPLNEIEDLAELNSRQREELLHLLEQIQETYESTGRFPDIHGRPLKGIRGPRKMNLRYTDNIIISEENAWLVDTDDIARNHSEDTFRGWLACKAHSHRLRKLKGKLQN